MSVTEFRIPPVIKVVTFPGPVEAAFARFTAGIGAWWPLASHSLAAQSPSGARTARTVQFERLEPGAGLVEVWHDGQSHRWGSIVACTPPSELAFTWHVGREPDAAQLITVRFTPDGDGGTRVTLEHAGWERLGEAAAAQRQNYDTGWNHVLARYAAGG